MTAKLRSSLAATACALAALVGCGAAAQTRSQPVIRFVVGAAAGGVLDPYARLVADHMARSLARTIIVENKPGANGNIAAQMIAEAPADGTLVWVGTQSMTEINPRSTSCSPPPRRRIPIPRSEPASMGKASTCRERRAPHCSLTSRHRSGAGPPW